MLLFLPLLLAQVALTQTVDVIYNVTREAYPTALPAEGASITITYTNGANPVVTETKTIDAAGAATFTVPLPRWLVIIRSSQPVQMEPESPSIPLRRIIRTSLLV